MHQLHRVGVGAAVLVDVEHMHDVGVRELRGGARFGDELRDERGVRRALLVEDLERHLPLQARLLGEVDLAHAAAAQFAQDLEAAHRWALGDDQLFL